MPDAEYKIFYTDGESLLWSEVGADGDPKLIPVEKRVGVHGIIQTFEDGASRDWQRGYHYVFSERHFAWVAMYQAELLERLSHDFDDIRCVLNGRTMPTGAYWDMNKVVRADTDIVGGDPVDMVEETAFIAEHRYNNPFWSTSRYGRFPGELLLDSPWTDPARHRWYPLGFTTEPVYGHQNYYG
jgi:hypothetical protein